jgi:hypothetical protein
MDTDKDRVIVSAGPAGSAAQIHHRDFAEIRTQGESPRDAAMQLINQLTRALDSALTTWRRESIEKAIADVKAFADQSPA